MGSKHGTAPTWRGECLHARRARRTSRCRRSEGGTVPQACAAGDRAPELPTPPRPCSLVQRSRMPDGLGQAMILRSSHPCLGTLFDHRGQRCEVSASNAPLTSAHRGTGSWSVRPIPRPSPPEWGSRWAPASGSKPWGGPTPSSCRRGATANTMRLCSNRCGGHIAAVPASSRCALVRSCLPPPVCWTGAGRRPTGCTPTNWPAAIPMSRSTPVSCTSTTATSSPRPALRPASTCACTSSVSTTEQRPPTSLPGAWSCPRTAMAVRRSSSTLRCPSWTLTTCLPTPWCGRRRTWTSRCRSTTWLPAQR